MLLNSIFSRTPDMGFSCCASRHISFLGWHPLSSRRPRDSRTHVGVLLSNGRGKLFYSFRGAIKRER